MSVMGRLTVGDLLNAFGLFLVLFLLLTGSLKYSAVLATFAVVNAAIVAYWFAVPAPEPVLPLPLSQMTQV